MNLHERARDGSRRAIWLGTPLHTFPLIYNLPQFFYNEYHDPVLQEARYDLCAQSFGEKAAIIEIEAMWSRKIATITDHGSLKYHDKKLIG